MKKSRNIKKKIVMALWGKKKGINVSQRHHVCRRKRHRVNAAALSKVGGKYNVAIIWQLKPSIENINNEEISIIKWYMAWLAIWQYQQI
jgi:hypothetical protein